MEISSTLKVVVFRLKSEKFGITVDQVLSIEKMQGITQIPNMPDYVSGIINLREKVIPIIDLRRYLIKEEVENKEENRIIVVKSQEKQVGIIVDEATDVLDIPVDGIQEVSLTGIQDNKLTQVAKMDSSLLILLNITTLLKDIDPANTLKDIEIPHNDQVM